MKINYNYSVQELEELAPYELELYYYMSLADWKTKNQRDDG